MHKKKKGQFINIIIFSKLYTLVIFQPLSSILLLSLAMFLTELGLLELLILKLLIVTRFVKAKKK